MINVPSTFNILLRHVRSLIPFVIVLPNTRQALVKVNLNKKKKIFFLKEVFRLGINSYLVNSIG